MVATDTTMSGFGGPHELGQLASGRLGERHAVVDADQGAIVRSSVTGTRGTSTAWLPTGVV